MDRKKFIQTSGLGLGLALIPNIGFSKDLEPKVGAHPKIIKHLEGDVLNILGDVQTHKLVGSDTANQIVEWVDDVEPGIGIPPHIHSKEDEIFRVIKGQLKITIDGNSTLLKAGDTAFAPKNVAHSWTVVGTEKAQMITSAFPAGIENMFKELANLPPGEPDLEMVAKICASHGVSFL